MKLLFEASWFERDSLIEWFRDNVEDPEYEFSSEGEMNISSAYYSAKFETKDFTYSFFTTASGRMMALEEHVNTNFQKLYEFNTYHEWFDWFTEIASKYTRFNELEVLEAPLR